MCNIYVDQWTGCKDKKYDLSVCFKHKEERPRGNQECTGKVRRIDYRDGVCPNHAGSKVIRSLAEESGRVQR
jgi:hypothetical protein